MQKVTVIGSGVMGRGIAYVSAAGGFDVTLVDIKQEQLDAAKKEIFSILEKGVARGKITESTRKQTINHLNYSTDLEVAAGNSDLVIEAVPEVLSIKKKFLKLLINLLLKIAFSLRTRQQ